MQQLGLMNLVLAKEYIAAARKVCPDDPLVVNELGVVALHNEKYVSSSKAKVIQKSQTLLLLTHDAKLGILKRSNSSMKHCNWQRRYKGLQLLGQQHISTWVTLCASSSMS
jgi:hypothetical protein